MFSVFYCYSQNGGLNVKELQVSNSVVVGDPGSKHVKVMPQYIQLALLSASEIDAINSPGPGALVYSTSSDIVLFYDGTQWRSFLSSSTGSSVVCPETITDLDGNSYGATVIGTQCWMTENMRATQTANGDAIPEYSDSGAWFGLDFGVSAYCSYPEADISAYGYLYNYAAAKSVCPVGWHLATFADWNALAVTLGGRSVAGGHLKESGISHWSSPNTDADNSSHFTALPGGNRDGTDGNFADLTLTGYFWVDNGTIEHSQMLWLYHNSAQLVFGPFYNSKYGFSVRCLKDN